MKLLIFGAGASLGSSEGSLRPKLMKDLLPELREKYPRWGSIPQDYAEARGNDFERIMDALLEGRMGDARFLNRDLGSYFAQFEPDSECLYVRLMRDADLSKVVICTLNYDLLLQRAARLCGKSFYITGFEYNRVEGGRPEVRPIPNRDDPSSPIELLLPHGSAGLVSEGVHAAYNDAPAGWYTRLSPETPYTRLCLDAQELEQSYKGNELNPIMSFIHTGKNTISGYKNLEATRARFAAVCKECDGIAIVGMQLNMRDDHISGPLIESRAPVLTAVKDDGSAYRFLGSRLEDTGQTWRDAFCRIASFLQSDAGSSGAAPREPGRAHAQPSTGAAEAATKSPFPQWPIPYKPVPVHGRSFANEPVVVDGHQYQHCTFDNVTFIYNGTTPVRFSHNKLSGARSIYTDNPAVYGTTVLLYALGHLPKDFEVGSPRVMWPVDERDDSKDPEQPDSQLKPKAPDPP